MRFWKRKKDVVSDHRWNMIRALAAAAVREATVEFHPAIEDSDGYYEEAHWWATRTGFQGAWGMGASRLDAVDDLRSAIEGWCEISLRFGHADIPVIEDIDVYNLSMFATAPVWSFAGVLKGDGNT